MILYETSIGPMNFRVRKVSTYELACEMKHETSPDTEWEEVTIDQREILLRWCVLDQAAKLHPSEKV